MLRGSDMAEEHDQSTEVRRSPAYMDYCDNISRSVPHVIGVDLVIVHCKVEGNM
jgi:hypothetical protein